MLSSVNYKEICWPTSMDRPTATSLELGLLGGGKLLGRKLSLHWKKQMAIIVTYKSARHNDYLYDLLAC